LPRTSAFGGVVPELASREHLDKIVPIVEEAFTRANVTKDQIDGIAVTIGPGLIGSLLVGVSYAKAMAFALNKPLVGVNHIEGHIYSVCLKILPSSIRRWRWSFRAGTRTSLRSSAAGLQVCRRTATTLREAFVCPPETTNASAGCSTGDFQNRRNRCGLQCD